MGAVLVATLGAEAQVVSLATALLLRQARLARVVVVHTDARFAPIDTALPTLCNAFAARDDAPVLVCTAVDVADTLRAGELERFADALFAVLKAEIGAGHSVHLLLAGGRKSMALVGMSVAQLLLGPDDHVWYLHSDDALRRSGRFWPEAGDAVQLIEMPLAPPLAAPPRFARSFAAASPAAARQALSEAEEMRLRHFVEHELTPAERAVAALFAQEVMTVEEAARRLIKQPKTITNQLTLIYAKLESYFGLTPDVGTKREFLRRVLRDWGEAATQSNSAPSHGSG